MRRKLIVVFAIATALAQPAVARAQKLVFVVRHAERADEPARNQQDPLLSAAGEARATKLEAMLADAGIRGIYVTKYRRTQDTAKPLAGKLKIKPELMPDSVSGLIEEMKMHHGKDVVLLVAHSTTIPGIIKGLGGPSVSLDESDYSSFFVVVPSTGAVSRLRF
jgi:broad specificity phosphatase PhoE